MSAAGIQGQMPKIEELIAFQMVAESGSYAAAARILRRDASIVSRRISALEASLGAKLITRSPKSVQLTAVGTKYLERVTAILADLHDANREASGRPAVA